MTDATVQSATGLARAPYDRVSFNVSLEGRANTGPEAKEKARKTIQENLNPVLQELERRGVNFDKDDKNASYSVVPQTEWDGNRQRPNGYLASFSLHLETDQVDRASEIQDLLTSVKNVTVSAPSFSLKSEKRRELQKVAIKQAFEVARDRFESECHILGMKPDDFEISSWTPQYSDQRRMVTHNAVRSFAAAAEMADDNDGSMTVESGLASVEVTLSIAFRRKFHQ